MAALNSSNCAPKGPTRGAFFLCPTFSFALCLLTLTTLVTVNANEVSNKKQSMLDFKIEREAASNGIAVKNFGAKDWPNTYKNSSSQDKLWESMAVELNLSLANDWTVGLVKRAEAALNLSADTTTLALLSATDTKPSNQTKFAISGNSNFWMGEGFQVKSPTFKLGHDTGYMGRVTFQYLNLEKYKFTHLTGNSQYTENRGYLSDIFYQKNYHTTTNRFLQPADSAGRALSISGQIRKNFDVGYVDLRAQDMLSQLKWGLLSENGAYNNLATTNVPVGIVGKQSYAQLSSKIDPKFRLETAIQTKVLGGSSGAFKSEWVQHAGLNQLWLGYDTELARSESKTTKTQYAFAADPILKGLRMRVSYQGFELQLVQGYSGHSNQVFGTTLVWRTAL